MEITKQEQLLIEKARKLGGEKPSDIISSLARIIPILIIVSVIVVIASSFIGAEAAQRYVFPALLGLSITLGGLAMASERKLLQIIKRQGQIIKNLEGKGK